MSDSASTSQPAAHTHRVTLLLALFGAALAAYALWRGDHNSDREDATRERVQQLETANATLRDELDAWNQREKQTNASLQKEWQQLADLPQQVKDLTAAHEALRARTERPQRAWTRAEAMYLIELAQRRLYFDHDTRTAIAALQSADSRLASLSDPSLAATRERLAKDLQTLRAVPVPDRTGIITRLTAIESQVANLPLKGILVGKRNLTTEAESGASLWQRAWQSVRSVFHQLFTVRNIGTDQGAVVSLEEQSLRRQHLALLAFSARQAVMRNDNADYQAAIQEMRDWLQRYFTATQSVATVDQELTSLQKIDIAPPLPDVSGAAQMLSRSTVTSHSNQ